MSTETNDDTYLTFDEAAALVKVSKDTIRRRVRAGALPVHNFSPRSPRIRRADLEQMAGTAGAKPDAVEQHILQLLKAAPPLSAAQRTRLAAIFAGGGAK